VKRGVREMSTRTLILFSCVVGMSVLVLALASCALFNKLPVAGFTIGPSTTGPAPFAVTLSGAPSSDSDGEIKTYSWDYGDGAVGTGRSVGHTYTAVGTYTIILTVTDNWDASDQAAKTVYVTAAEPAGPSASFTASPTSGTSPLNVTFDASGSSYAAGTIAAYEWTFGDGGNGFGKSVTHSFFSSGSQSFTVTLLVRASDGKTASASRTVSVSTSGGGGTPAASAPSARFDIQTDSLGVAPLQVAFDPSDSEAANGRSLILYTWSWGDGKAESDPGAYMKTHVFTTKTSSEVFSVTLVVMDNASASNSITKTVKAYNFRPVAGFEIANPPGGWGTPPDGLVQYATLDGTTIPDNRWVADNVVYGNLSTQSPSTTVRVWIRSKQIPDARWRGLIATTDQHSLMTATGSAITATTPTAPTGYDKNNFSYDPEGQTWAANPPTWFPDYPFNPAWGIKYLYISWGDSSALVTVPYNPGALGNLGFHDYPIANGPQYTITVTAEDWLGYQSAAFSRKVTLKTGPESGEDI
jgi:PKD repeat protein